MIVLGIGIDLELVGTRCRRGQQQFTGRLPAAHRHGGSDLGIRIDRPGQTGADFNKSIAGLRCISDVMAIDHYRVEILNIARQGDLANLIGQ